MNFIILYKLLHNVIFTLKENMSEICNLSGARCVFLFIL